MSYFHELSLSGAGARGAFQFAFAKTLIEAGYEFGHCSGVSAGAVNAYLLSTDDLSLGETVWLEEVPALFTRRDKIEAIARIILGKPSAFSEAVARRLVDRHVDFDRVKRNFAVWFVDYSGELVGIGTKYIPNTEQLRNFIRASFAIPGVFPPVEYAYSTGGDYIDLIDAGVRAMIPPAYFNPITRLIVTAKTDLDDFFPSRGGGVLQSALRAYDMMSAEISRNDLEGRDYVSPLSALPGAFDFSREAVEESWRVGLETAKAWLQGQGK